MAAGAIGLATTFGPMLIPLIATLVHRLAPQAEAKYGAGTGPVKAGEVFTGVITALQSAAAAGKIPKDLPAEETVKLIIDAVVTSMKLSGVLAAPAASLAGTAPALTAPISLTAGQSITITAA